MTENSGSDSKPATTPSKPPTGNKGTREAPKPTTKVAPTNNKGTFGKISTSVARKTRES